MSSELRSIHKEIIDQVANKVRLTEEFDNITKNRGGKSKAKK
jgi:hypothetical protein